MCCHIGYERMIMKDIGREGFVVQQYVRIYVSLGRQTVGTKPPNRNIRIWEFSYLVKFQLQVLQKKMFFFCNTHVCTYCVQLQLLGMIAMKLTELYALNFLLAPINCNHGNHAVSCNDDCLYSFT